MFPEFRVERSRIDRLVDILGEFDLEDGGVNQAAGTPYSRCVSFMEPTSRTC
jgi:hypothetical protein